MKPARTRPAYPVLLSRFSGCRNPISEKHPPQFKLCQLDQPLDVTIHGVTVDRQANGSGASSHAPAGQRALALTANHSSALILFAKLVKNGTAKETTLFADSVRASETHAFSRTETPQYNYDPAKAKALLAEAGYPDGGFTIKYTYETGYWWKRPLGELFQDNMKDLGISVEIQELSPAVWAELLTNPEVAEHAYGLVWWPTLNSPSDYLWSMFHSGGQGTAGFNWNYYSNEEVDRLLDAAPGESDAENRQEMYARLQNILVEDAPGLFVYEKNYRLPMREEVKGFVFNGVYIEMLDFYALHK